ncbi:cystathionine gamma-synthase [Candidatus Micrarchaeota archaeon]|nr:cystathionine gamma-synthase [Candidatus Micrarchaeota archaeon]
MADEVTSAKSSPTRGWKKTVLKCDHAVEHERFAETKRFTKKGSGAVKFNTKAVHAGEKPDSATGALATPIYQTSTYAQDAPNQHKGFDYSRAANPTRQILENNLAALENVDYAVAFSSGLAATSSVLNLFKQGDHVVASQDMYGGTYRLFKQLYEKYGVTFDFVDATNSDALQSAIKPNTKLVWIETPSNPLLKITDIKAAAAIAHDANARLAVDSTLATPHLQQPFSLGADLVVHSTTKYLNGHADVIGGAVCVKDKTLYEQLRFWQKSVGSVPGPLDCYLVLRGIKTLPLRMDQHSKNAMTVAQFLQSHPKVKRVIYPGLQSHPQHELAKKQMTAFSGMIAVELDASFEKAMAFASNLELFTLAEDLGGVKSLTCHPASMTHAAVPKQERLKTGFTDELIRLSIGIEDADDLIEDLEKALDPL